MTTSTLHNTGALQDEERATHQGHNRDLAERAAMFAQNARTFVRRIPKTIASMGDCRRLVRSSGDIGAAYLDADKALSKTDFLQCMRDCCREARQTQHWLRLLDVNLDERTKQLHEELLQEATELEKIFGSIVYKVKNKTASNDQ